MKYFCKSAFILFVLLLAFNSLSAQIVINGYNPRRIKMPNAQNSISISYGYSMWGDGNHVPVNGYSYSRSFYHSGFGDPLSAEKENISVGINIGYEKRLTNLFSLKGSLSSTKLETGTSTRIDLITTDKSRFTQFGLYGKYSLTKDLNKTVQFQWLFGPEVIYAKRDVFIQDYVLNDSEIPETYRQHVQVLEVAAVTGLGLSIKITNALSLISEGMIGVSLPGTGLKVTTSLAGLKYNW
jgi:hypothetical protein